MAHYRSAGNAHFAAGRYDEASVAYTLALQEVSSLASADDTHARTDLRVNLALSRLRLGDHAEAERLVSTALADEPENARALKLRAKLQKHAQAAAHSATPGAHAPAAEPADAQGVLVEATEVVAPYSGLDEVSDKAAIESSLARLQLELEPKMQELIDGVDRWVDRLEHALATGVPTSSRDLGLGPDARAPGAAAPVGGTAVLCCEFDHVLFEMSARSSTEAILEACGVATSAPDTAVVPAVGDAAATSWPAHAEAAARSSRERVTADVQCSVVDVAQLVHDKLGGRLRDDFITFCEDACVRQWELCVLTSGIKPFVRHLLREAGLSHVPTMAADGICRAATHRWECTSWEPTDRIRALRAWLDTRTLRRADGGSPHVIYVGAQVSEACLLRAEPQLIDTLLVVPGSDLERWCNANSVRYRSFTGFDDLSVLLTG